MKKVVAILMVVAVLLTCGIPAFASTSAKAEQNSDELVLCDYWISKNSEIRPFGENRLPDDVFIADMDNDKAPELVLFFSYLGPGGPTFAIYKNVEGTVVHHGNFMTSSGTGIHHNLSLVLEDNGDLKILDHYVSYPSDEIGEQSVLLAQYNPKINIAEKYAKVWYYGEIGYTTDLNKENKVYCTKQEADAFFDSFCSELSNNVVFSSEDDNKQSNDFFGIWTKQNELRDSITVLLDGKKLIFDQPPVVVDNRTLVPLRAIFEELGATVSWDNETQTATAVKGDTTVSVTIGKAEIYKNGECITLDVASQAKGGRTLVPLRAVSESFNCKVDWNNSARTVVINTAN